MNTKRVLVRHYIFGIHHQKSGKVNGLDTSRVKLPYIERDDNKTSHFNIKKKT